MREQYGLALNRLGNRKEAIKVIENGRRRVIRDDYTGTVQKVNTGLLRLLLERLLQLVRRQQLSLLLRCPHLPGML